MAQTSSLVDKAYDRDLFQLPIGFIGGQSTTKEFSTGDINFCQPSQIYYFCNSQSCQNVICFSVAQECIRLKSYGTISQRPYDGVPQ